MMIVDLLIFLLPKFFAGVIAGSILFIYYKMRKINIVYSWIYFAMGMAGYNILCQFTWGWLQHTEFAMEMLCAIAMVVFQHISLFKMRKELKYNKARQRAALDTIAQLDAFQARWLRDEVTDEEYKAFMCEMREKRLPYLRQEEAMIMR